MGKRKVQKYAVIDMDWAHATEHLKSITDPVPDKGASKVSFYKTNSLNKLYTRLLKEYFDKWGNDCLPSLPNWPGMADDKWNKIDQRFEKGISFLYLLNAKEKEYLWKWINCPCDGDDTLQSCAPRAYWRCAFVVKLNGQQYTSI